MPAFKKLRGISYHSPIILQTLFSLTISSLKPKLIVCYDHAVASLIGYYPMALRESEKEDDCQTAVSGHINTRIWVVLPAAETNT
jgi:hypothetical protein